MNDSVKEIYDNLLLKDKPELRKLIIPFKDTDVYNNLYNVLWKKFTAKNANEKDKENFLKALALVIHDYKPLEEDDYESPNVEDIEAMKLEAVEALQQMKESKKVKAPSPKKASSPVKVKVKVPSPVKVKAPSPVKVKVPSPVKVKELSPVKVKVKAPSPVKVKVKVPSPVKVKVKVPSPVKVKVPSPVKVKVPSPKKVPVVVIKFDSKNKASFFKNDKEEKELETLFKDFPLIGKMSIKLGDHNAFIDISRKIGRLFYNKDSDKKSTFYDFDGKVIDFYPHGIELTFSKPYYKEKEKEKEKEFEYLKSLAKGKKCDMKTPCDDDDICDLEEQKCTKKKSDDMDRFEHNRKIFAGKKSTIDAFKQLIEREAEKKEEDEEVDLGDEFPGAEKLTKLQKALFECLNGKVE